MAQEPCPDCKRESLKKEDPDWGTFFAVKVVLCEKHKNQGRVITTHPLSNIWQ